MVHKQGMDESQQKTTCTLLLNDGKKKDKKTITHKERNCLILDGTHKVCLHLIRFNALPKPVSEPVPSEAF